MDGMGGGGGPKREYPCDDEKALRGPGNRASNMPQLQEGGLELPASEGIGTAYKPLGL